jgi:hypothetical protein
MTNVASLSIHNGNSTFHNGINNANDLMFLGIYDLHDAYRWYNDHVAFVPHNAIRVLRVAQSVWTFTMNTTTGKYSAMNRGTGRMKLLPKLRRSPVSTNSYAKFLRHLATGATVNNIDRVTD